MIICKSKLKLSKVSSRQRKTFRGLTSNVPKGSLNNSLFQSSKEQHHKLHVSSITSSHTFHILLNEFLHLYTDSTSLLSQNVSNAKQPNPNLHKVKALYHFCFHIYITSIHNII